MVVGDGGAVLVLISVLMPKLFLLLFVAIVIISICARVIVISASIKNPP